MTLPRDVGALSAVTDELHPLAERNNFSWMLADANFMRGWLAARNGDLAGLDAMLKYVDHPFLAAFRPVYLVHLAAEQLRAGQIEPATATLDRTVSEAEQQANFFCAPETIRLRGEVLLAQSRIADAEQALREAVSLAGRQSCRPYELRAATSLASLLATSHRRDEARDILAPIYAGFTEGFGFADLQAAKALLDASI